MFIIDAFAAFERLLRKRVLDSLESQKNELSANLVQVVRNESEFIKIETLLNVLKNFVDLKRIGLIKQIKRYRDWVAHGKRPLTYSPVKPVDIYVIFEAIRLVAVTVTSNNE